MYIYIYIYTLLYIHWYIYSYMFTAIFVFFRYILRRASFSANLLLGAYWKLATSAAFESHLRASLLAAKPVDVMSLTSGRVDSDVTRALRILYDDKSEYKPFALKLGLMPDEKEGIRRMSFKGVIPFAYQGRRVFLYTRNWPEGLD